MGLLRLAGVQGNKIKLGILHKKARKLVSLAFLFAPAAYSMNVYIFFELPLLAQCYIILMMFKLERIFTDAERSHKP